MQYEPMSKNILEVPAAAISWEFWAENLKGSAKTSRRPTVDFSDSCEYKKKQEEELER